MIFNAFALVLPPMQNYLEMMISANYDNHLIASLKSEDELRAFGIFCDGLTNGMFMSVALTFLLAKLFCENKRSLFDITLICLLVSAIYFTYTRSCYVSSFVGLVSILSIRTRLTGRKVLDHPKLVTLFWIGIYLFLMYFTVWYVLNVSGFNLSNDTLSARIYSWDVVFYKFIWKGDIVHILFGYGISQWSGSHQDNDLWLLDNLFIQVYMLSGLLGLGIFVHWWYKISSSLLRVIAYSKDYVNIATYAVFNEFLVSGVFNSNLYLNPVSPLILILCYLAFARFDSASYLKISTSYSSPLTA